MTLKEEFDQLLRDYTGNTEDAQSCWDWVLEQLKKSYGKGFDEGIEWAELENKDEEIWK